jgi:hypothetical protein
MESSDDDGDSNWRRWRTARIERCTEIQRRTREWINFAEIAEWCSDESGVVPNEDARGAAYQKLQHDLLEGDFEENGRSRVLYLHLYSTKARMTRDWLTRQIETSKDQTTINSQYLAHCWIRRDFFERWLAKHRLPESPPRFQPRQASSRQPRPSHKGGAPPKADWEALKEPLRQEIEIRGYPDPRNPPGWQRTKDVVEWAFEKLGKEGEHVSPRTVGDNLRKILRELKDSSAKPVSR